MEHYEAKRISLIQGHPNDQIPEKLALYAVVNPIDYCPVGCPHCMFSSRKKYIENTRLTIEQAEKAAQIFSEAGLKKLVITGGGEPFENLESIYILLSQTRTLKRVVFITSSYFAVSSEETAKYLDKIIEILEEKRVSVVFRLSRDRNYSKTVPFKNVVNVINYLANKNLQSRVIIRGLMSDNDNLYNEFVGFGYSLRTTMPYLIDGLNVVWYKDTNGVEIPVILKPDYFTGRNKTQNKTGLQSTSVWDVIDIESNAGTPLNLSRRGEYGEGHDYYENILNGYDYCYNLIVDGQFNQDKSKVQKAIALYLSADGRLSINAGVPDNHFALSNVTSWEDFLRQTFSDPLQWLLYTKGPLYIFDNLPASKQLIYDKITDSNFVFSVSLYCLLLSELRYYFTLLALRLQGKVSDNTVANEEMMVVASVGLKQIDRIYDRTKKQDPIRGGLGSILD